jgi:hypothetical protein
MSAPPTSTGIEPGLMSRFRAAGGQLVWRAAPSPKRRNGAATSSGARIAHLHDEESRVEERLEDRTRVLVVESSPVGALVVVVALDDRGLPNALVTRDAGVAPGFPAGAIEARWVEGSEERSFALSVADVVALARYALV